MGLIIASDILVKESHERFRLWTTGILESQGFRIAYLSVWRFVVKAFLSHSSKDKHFVREVAKNLGNLQIEYDEYTFEYVLNAEAIRRALARSDLFVLFLSENSVNSSFVKEEIRSTLEARARGQIKQVLIFAIDNTSYRALPGWLREINIVQHLGNAKACARKIQATLISLEPAGA